MAIRIPIIADVVDAIRGARKLGESFDDVADALETVDHAADAAGTGVAQVGDAAASTTRGAAELESSFKDAFDTVRKESKTAGDGVGDSMKHGTDGAKAGVEDFGSEAQSTAKETAASFDGSAESITGAFQEVAANAFAGFGPAGAVAGLAAAAGIGLVTKSMEDAKERAAQTAEQVAEIAGELIDLGAGARHLGAEQVTDALNDMATTAKDGKVPLDELRKTTDQAGVSFTDYAQGIAGDSSALRRSYDEVISKQEDLGAAYTATLDSQGNLTGATGRWLDKNKGAADALEDARQKLLAMDGTLDRAGTTAQNFEDATQGITTAAEQQAQTHQRTRERIEELSAATQAYNDTLEATADPVTVYEGLLDRKNTAEREAAEATAAATKDQKDSWEDYAQGVTVTTQDLIDEWNRQAAENAAFSENLAKIGAAGGQALADELRAKGPEVAGATAAALAGADPAQQQAAIDAHARATGVAAGASIATGISTSKTATQLAVDDVVGSVKAPGIRVGLIIDPSALDRELSKPRRVDVVAALRAGGSVAV